MASTATEVLQQLLGNPADAADVNALLAIGAKYVSFELRHPRPEARHAMGGQP